MTKVVIQNIVRWVLLMAVQVLVFNNIYLGGTFNPYIYVLIILSLPIEISALATLFIGFFTGFILDLFTHTYGMHTMAFTLFGFLRPLVLRGIAPRDGYAFGSSANVRDMGFGLYSVYALILIFTHHLLLFVLEGFASQSVWITTKKVILNTLLTFVIIMVTQSFSRKKDK